MPLLAASVIVPLPDWPEVGKLQFVPDVGAAKEKFRAFVPVILCAVIVTDDALVLMTATFMTGAEVVPRNVAREIGFGLKTMVPALIVKLNGNAGVGPPPGTGLVMVPETGIAVMRSDAGTWTSKTVPPELAVPLRVRLPNVVNVTVVLFTKCNPVKCIVYGVPALVVRLVNVGVPRIGFITVKGAPAAPST